MTISGLRSRFDGKTWCALYGSSGTGKTQLARLMIGVGEFKCSWLRLRDLTTTEAIRRIFIVLNRLSPRQSNDGYDQWLLRAIREMGHGGAIVLDDLPSSGDASWGELLGRICIACRDAGVFLLTLADKPLWSSIRSLVAANIHEELVPPLLDEEIRDIFLQHGAPTEFVDSKLMKAVSVTSHRHPVLVVEAAHHFAAGAWQWSEESYGAVVSGSYAEGLDARTMGDIRRTVSDDQQRELLYRIKLIGSSFGQEYIQWISDVSPTVERAHERFTGLIGLWVQRDTGTLYTVSPLVASLRGSNLPKDRERAVHVAIGDGVVQRRRLAAEDFLHVLFHYSAGEEYRRAGTVLLMGLQAILNAPRPVEDLGISGFWADTPLPEPIDHGTKVFIRVMQAAVHNKAGKPITYVVNDIDRLLAQEEPSALIMVGLAGTLASTLFRREPIRSLGYLMRGIVACRTATAAGGLPEERDLTKDLIELLWMIGASLRTDGDFETWFGAIQQLTSEEAQGWGDSSMAMKSSELICTGVWTRMADMSETARNWVPVMDRLSRLRDWGAANRVIQLDIHAVRGQIIVTAEYLKDLPGAVRLAEARIATYSGDPRANFYVAEITARQFYFQDRPIEGLQWFERAFSTESGAEPATLATAWLFAAAAAAKVSMAVAFDYLNRAVRWVDSVPETVKPSLLTAQAWGELAIAHWTANDRTATYQAWRRAVEELLSAKQDKDEWRILFQIMGNFTGYFAHISQSLGESSWPHARPGPGLLLKLPQAVVSLYHSDRDWLIFAQMTLFADGVQEFEDAVNWSMRLAEYADRLPSGMGVLVRGYWVPQLLKEGKLTSIIIPETVAPGNTDVDASWRDIVSPEDSERAANFRERAGRVNFVAVSIDLARRWIADRHSALALLEEVVNTCREAGRSASPWWVAAGEAVATLGSDAGWRILYDRGAALMDSDSHLAVIYYLAAMLKAPPNHAVQLQMSVIPWMRSIFSKALFHFTMSALVFDYWSWAMAQYPAHFSMQRVTQSELDQAASLRGEDRVRHVFRAVCTSLNARPASDEMKNWLFGNLS